MLCQILVKEGKGTVVDMMLFDVSEVMLGSGAALAISRAWNLSFQLLDEGFMNIWRY